MCLTGLPKLFYKINVKKSYLSRTIAGFYLPIFFNVMRILNFWFQQMKCQNLKLKNNIRTSFGRSPMLNQDLTSRKGLYIYKRPSFSKPHIFIVLPYRTELFSAWAFSQLQRIWFGKMWPTTWLLWTAIHWEQNSNTHVSKLVNYLYLSFFANFVLISSRKALLNLFTWQTPKIIK